MRKIEISKENAKNIINELRFYDDANDTIKKILQVRESLKELFSKCNKGVQGYDSLIVWAEFGRNPDVNYKYKSFVVKILIQAGEFYLIEIYGAEKWRAGVKIELELHGKSSEISEYLLEDYKGNSVEVRGNIVTFSLKRKRLVFDYELGRYEDFTKILDYYLSHIPKQVLKRVKEEAYSLYENYFPDKIFFKKTKGMGK